MTDFFNVLSKAVQDGNYKKVIQLVKEALAEGDLPPQKEQE